MRIAQFGTFDVENYGDLLFPLIVQKRFSDEDLELTAVSPVGGPSIWSDCVPSISFDEFVERSEPHDGFIVGGGNIIHASATALETYDTGGVSPLVAYPNLWLGAAWVAARRGVSLCWNSPGVPARLDEEIAALAGWALSQADYISVRDAQSRTSLEPAKVGQKIHVVPDSGLDVAELWSQQEIDAAYEEAFQSRGREIPRRALVFHANRRYTDETPEATAGRLDRICEHGQATPILIAFGPCHGDDHLQRSIAAGMRTAPLVIDRPRSLREVAACIARSEGYLGSSLHGVITACSFGVRGAIVGSAMEPKFRGFLEQFSLEAWLLESWKEAEERSEQFFTAPVSLWERVPGLAAEGLDRHWDRIMSAMKSPADARTRTSVDTNEQGLHLLATPDLHDRDYLQPVVLRSAVECFRKFVKFRQRVESLQAELKEEKEARKPEKIVALENDLHQVNLLLEAANQAREAQNERIRQLWTGIKTLRGQLRMVLDSRQFRLGERLAMIYRMVRRRKPKPSLRTQVKSTLRRVDAWRENLADEHATSRGELAASMPFRYRSRRASVVVCIHNAPDDFRRCIGALEQHTNLYQHELILVDDGSAEETSRLVVDAVTRLGSVYIRNDESRGYTRAANQGIEAATGSYVILLNSDTVVTAGWLDKLIRCAESAPRVGCVGPLSNAASWQSIPRLTDDKGQWCVNDLPEGVSLEEYARAVDSQSARLYPSVPLVNGFCYCITREALNAVGQLDEKNFPLGYGEEDDFSIRLLDAKFHHRIADDCYVYHAKSKSFTPERRQGIVEKSKHAIREKHGPERLQAFVEDMRQHEGLLRARVRAELAGESTLKPATTKDYSSSRLTVGWLLPHLGVAGGVRRAIEMTNRMAAWGVDAMLFAPGGEKTSWLPIAATVVPIEKLGEHAPGVLLVTDPDVVEAFSRAEASLKIVYHLAAYRLYRDPSPQMTAFHAVRDRAIHVANSRWTADQVNDVCHVEAILPGGIDRRLFRPVDTELLYDAACFGSARRTKGSAAIEDAAGDLKLLRLAELGAEQKDLARHICSARVFVSACSHEGFNFCPLEAMACGVPVVMTDDGGSREYAKDGENALVLASADQQRLREAIRTALQDNDLRLKLIEGGLRTAWNFTWDRVTEDLTDLIVKRLQPA